jgi:hypothetical protein
MTRRIKVVFPPPDGDATMKSSPVLGLTTAFPMQMILALRPARRPPRFEVRLDSS